MKLDRTVVGIRTHQWTEAERSLYITLQQYFSERDIYAIVDETKQKVNIPNDIKKITLDKAFLENKGILSDHPNPKGIGWLCGDYFYYSFASEVDAVFYWLIEPDVGFNFDNITVFFQRYESVTQDALLYNFAQAAETWAWTNRAKLIASIPYQAFFPLSRLSRQAVLACLNERVALTRYFVQNNVDRYHYPNDESLVATAVVKHQLSVENLESIWEGAFNYFTYRNLVVGENALSLLPNNQVVHPYRPIRYVTDMLFGEINRVVNQTLPKDIISKMSLHPDDISLIFADIRKNILQDTQTHMQKQAKYTAVFDFVYRSLNNFTKNTLENITYKVWIFKKYTLVLDVYFQREQMYNYVIEYIFQNEKITCNIFFRKGNEKPIESLAGQNNWEYKKGKWCLFETLVDNKKIELMISNSLDFFKGILVDSLSTMDAL